MENPQYQHDCDTCTFLGQYKNYDLYFCPQRGLPTVIARWSDNGPDYTSGMVFAKNGTSKPLVEALKRANKMGISTKQAYNRNK